MDINFKSFSISPSDHECQQGDLASVQNLVYEDGALKPIPLPSHIASVPNSPAVNDTEYYIHEVDTDSLTDSDNINYIAISSGESGNHVYWCNNIQNGAIAWTKIDDLDDFKVNAVTFTGRIMNLIGNEETIWAIWRGSSYQIVRLADFQYTIGLRSDVWKDTTPGGYFSFSSQLGSDYSGCFVLGGNGIAGTKGCSVTSVSSAGLNAFADAITAKVNSVIANDNEIHRNISFGFAAVRMYDGSYIALSDLFVVGPRLNLTDISIHFRNTEGYTLNIIANEYLHKNYISVDFPKLNDLKQLIQSIDIFETPPSIFRRLNKAISLNVEGGAIYPWDDDSYTGGVISTNITLESLSEKELHTEIENLSFHKVLSLTVSEVASSTTTPIALKSCDETEQALALADFFKANHGASVASNYNSRLLLADFVEILKYTPSQQITYTYNSDWVKQLTSGTSVLEWNGKYIDYIADGSINKFRSADIYYVIRWADSFGSSHSIISHAEDAQATIPFLTIPWPELTSVDIYMKTTDRNGNEIYLYKQDLPITNCETGIWGYNLQTLDNTITFLSPYICSADGTWSRNPLYTEDAGGREYSKIDAKYTSSDKCYINRYRNRILVSDADNPFLFRDSATISVGNGSVLALAAPTQPISQGQAGQTPLVAFTSEGIYPLYVGNDGSLVATQPGPRDVLINSKAVLPIDDAIVFATSRGLMLYAGSKTQCITDSLRGKVFDGIVPYLSAVMSSNGTTYTSNKIGSYAPLANLESFLSDCRLMYNYIDQQLLAFLPDVAKVLVYSLRSGAWGAADYDYRKPLNSYPDALAIGYKNGAYELVNVHNGSTTDSIPVSLVSRPISLGEPDTLKRISSAIFRGYFAKGHVKSAVYGSRDLLHWQLINTSVDHILRNRMGSPYKYFRFAALGNLSHDESVYGVSVDASPSMANQLR